MPFAFLLCTSSSVNVNTSSLQVYRTFLETLSSVSLTSSSSGVVPSFSLVINGSLLCSLGHSAGSLVPAARRGLLTSLASSSSSSSRHFSGGSGLLVDSLLALDASLKSCRSILDVVVILTPETAVLDSTSSTITVPGADGVLPSSKAKVRMHFLVVGATNTMHALAEIAATTGGRMCFVHANNETNERKRKRDEDNSEPECVGVSPQVAARAVATTRAGTRNVHLRLGPLESGALSAYPPLPHPLGENTTLEVCAFATWEDVGKLHDAKTWHVLAPPRDKPQLRMREAAEEEGGALRWEDAPSPAPPVLHSMMLCAFGAHAPPDVDNTAAAGDVAIVRIGENNDSRVGLLYSQRSQLVLQM